MNEVSLDELLEKVTRVVLNGILIPKISYYNCKTLIGSTKLNRKKIIDLD